MSFKFLASLVGLTVLSICALFAGGQALAQPDGEVPPPTPIDTWAVPKNSNVDVISNNQVPGNYKIANNGVKSVYVQAFDAEGEALGEKIKVDPNMESPQVGVGKGESLKITNQAGTPATGTVWKFS